MNEQRKAAFLLKEKIEEYDNILIAKHVSPDWDAIGSAKGLKEIILDNFTNKKVFVVGREINGIDLIDDKNLNEDTIIKSLLITVDSANIERVDFDRIDLVKEAFRIDHHINTTPYTKNEYVFESAIACTQVITLWANELNLKISKKAAEFLYRGLVTDSNRFFYKNTDESTFKAAAVLARSGINIYEINKELYSRSLKEAIWLNKAFSLVKFNLDLKYAYIVFDEKIISENNLSQEDIKITLSILSNIEEIDVWFIIYLNKETNKIRVSLRSKFVAINELAMKYNGGGHKLASGAELSDWDKVNNFIKDLESLLKE